MGSMSAQPYSLESTVKGTAGSHSLLTAQVSINRTPSSHNPWTCSCHISVRGDRLCLQTYPSPSPSPHPCSTLPKEKPPWCLRSHTMSWSYLSQYLPLSSATWPSRDHPCSVFSDVWVWFLLFCGLPEFSSAMLHGGDILPFQVVKSTCLYSEILNVVKPHLKKSYTDISSQHKLSVAQGDICWKEGTVLQNNEDSGKIKKKTNLFARCWCLKRANLPTKSLLLVFTTECCSV